MGLFYFAGHGVQVDGRNYLIPVDADLPNASLVEFRTVAADEVLAYMQDAGAGVNMFFLDACRDNPLPQASRSLSRGLAAASVRPPETMIVCATGAGQTADDGVGRNSPFTRAFLRHIATPGQDVYDLYRSISREVMAETQGRQRPEQYGNITVRYSIVEDVASARAESDSLPEPLQLPDPTEERAIESRTVPISGSYGSIAFEGAAEVDVRPRDVVVRIPELTVTFLEPQTANRFDDTVLTEIRLAATRRTEDGPWKALARSSRPITVRLSSRFGSGVIVDIVFDPISREIFDGADHVGIGVSDRTLFWPIPDAPLRESPEATVAVGQCRACRCDGLWTCCRSLGGDRRDSALAGCGARRCDHPGARLPGFVGRDSDGFGVSSMVGKGSRFGLVAVTCLIVLAGGCELLMSPMDDVFMVPLSESSLYGAWIDPDDYETGTGFAAHMDGDTIQAVRFDWTTGEIVGAVVGFGGPTYRSSVYFDLNLTSYATLNTTAGLWEEHGPTDEPSLSVTTSEGQMAYLARSCTQNSSAVSPDPRRATVKVTMRSSLVVFFLPRGAGYRTIAEVSILEFEENDTTPNRANTSVVAVSVAVPDQAALLAAGA